MSIEIKKIEIEIGDITLNLSPEQVQELRAKLNNLAGIPNYYMYPTYPSFPTYPTYYGICSSDTTVTSASDNITWTS